VVLVVWGTTQGTLRSIERGWRKSMKRLIIFVAVVAPLVLALGAYAEREQIYHVFAKADANGEYPDGTLAAGISAIQGRVESDGQPLRGAHVEVDDADYNTKAKTDTDANGAYTVFLPPGSYAVTVTKGGYLGQEFKAETHSQLWHTGSDTVLDAANPLEGTRVQLAETLDKDGVRLILARSLMGKAIFLRCNVNLNDGNGNGVCPEPVVRISYTLKTAPSWYADGCDAEHTYWMNPGGEDYGGQPDGRHIAVCEFKP
jgi:Carboxypeptidase regulatory-like domain